MILLDLLASFCGQRHSFGGFVLPFTVAKTYMPREDSRAIRLGWPGFGERAVDRLQAVDLVLEILDCRAVIRRGVRFQLPEHFQQFIVSPRSYLVVVGQA